MWFNKVDKIYCINLKKRPDRKQNVSKVFEQLGILDKIEWFEAIDHTEYTHTSQRAAGCSYSHLKIWKKTIENEYENILIFEDDFELCTDRKTFEKTILQLFEKYPNFSICNIAYNGKGTSICDNFSKAVNIQTTSAYFAKTEFLKKLISPVEKATENLMKKQPASIYAIDIVWKLFQHDKNWIISKRLGTQKEGFSDIEKRNVKYGV